ncbi:MAG TPA: twin-arginine translocase subunit TatC [Solirubrobacteraceae bacterium]|jgi:sec-independent protein translocase protein TatC
MSSTLRPIGHEDRLSLVDHLDELRSRLIICGAVLVVAFGFCFWQNHELLRIINKPLQEQTSKQIANGRGTLGQASIAQKAVIKTAQDTRSALSLLASPSSGVAAGTRTALKPLISALKDDIAKLPRKPPGENPAVFGVGEAFTTTLTVTLYFALIISLPVILYELFGFLLPALAPNERRAITPVLMAIPALFVLGVLFGYFVVLPAAVRFFVNFNSGEFNVIVQASQFYSFASTVLLAMGAIFQVPVLIIGAVRLDLVTPRQLRKNRRYAIVVCAAVAALLPGDFITLLLETVPLYLLYEVSILLSAMLGRKWRRSAEAANAAGVTPDEEGAAVTPDEDGDTSVQQIIDHVDHDHYD